MSARHEPVYEARYRGYVLRYRPQPMPDGRFLAFVIVGRELDGLRAQLAWTPDVDAFRYQPDAALAGMRAGKAWVDATLARGERWPPPTQAQAQAEPPRITA
jgi:hypothetical protein